MVVASGVLLASGLLTGPEGDADAFDPASATPDGLLGLVRLLESQGVVIDVSLEPPVDMSTVAFVPVDRLGRHRDAWQRWVEAGGLLVLADPGSPLHDLTPVAARFVDAVGPTSRVPGCRELGAVGMVTHSGWSGYEIPPGAASCFPLGAGSAWLVVDTVGAGRLVALGSPAPFANAALALDDNAVLAATVLAPAPGDRLVVVPRAPVGEGEMALLDLIPPRVWRGLAMVALAALLAAVAVGRRLGRVVDDDLPPVLPASELAYSLGGLLQRAGRPDDAAATLREEARRAVARATGAARPLPDDELVGLAVDRLGVHPGVAGTALGDRPVDDERALLEVHAAVCAILARSDVRAPSVAADPTGSPR